MKHWIFHKYKWETYDTKPVFVKGLFQDYMLERRFQSGSCQCGAYKFRDIDVDPFLEMDIKMAETKLKAADLFQKQGRFEEAIEILKL